MVTRIYAACLGVGLVSVWASRSLGVGVWIIDNEELAEESSLI